MRELPRFEDDVEVIRRLDQVITSLDRRFNPLPEECRDLIAILCYLKSNCRLVPDSARPSYWRPIEEAPNDGTSVLLALAPSPEGIRAMTTGYNNHFSSVAPDFGWTLCENSSDFFEEGNVYPYPTHWMPLPEPPK